VPSKRPTRKPEPAVLAAPEASEGSAASLIPPHATLKTLQRSAAGCKACELWKTGTQTVFGEGPSPARIMFVGEQPGDREDLAGHPFIGPAGRILDEAMQLAGLDRSEAYVTNMVKHFRWEQASRGKRRIHKKPRASQIEACRPWLDAELQVVRPEVLICLGATAAQALLGKQFSVLRQRGQVQRSTLAPFVLATVHPSSILRSPDPESRDQAMKDFVKDLKQAARALESKKSAA
jgi:uracil-DNA glycosylase